MAQLPRNKEIVQAIRALVRQARLAAKETNQLAAKRVARGDYAGAQSYIELAQAILGFSDEVSTLSGRWRTLRSAGKPPKKARGSQTALWEFYQPILRALIALDGEATRTDIEEQLEGAFTGSLKEGDFVTNKRGVPQWRIMVARARKHMIAEGFVNGDNIKKWKITSKGEQAARRGVKDK